MSATPRLQDYTPREGSVAWKVIEYLTTNPGESLSSDGIAAKCDVGRNNVHSLLAQAVDVGILVRKEDLESGELVYRRGKGHPSVKANVSRNPSLRAAASPWSESVATSARSPRATRYRLVLDVETLQIKDGVPLPPISAHRRSTDWPALFKRMKVGQSVTLPKAVKSTLKKAITIQHAENLDVEFATRIVDAEHLGLWRVR